jgi:hypothetical protein
MELESCYRRETDLFNNGNKDEMARHHRLFSSYEQAIVGLDQAVEFLRDIRCKITADNFSNFGIQIDHSIGQFDFLSTDQQPAGVIQTVPGILSIEVKDCTNLGKNLGNLWEFPTRAEVDAAFSLGSGSRLEYNRPMAFQKRKPIPKHLIRRPTFPVIKADDPFSLMGHETVKPGVWLSGLMARSKPEPKRKHHESVSNSRKRLSRVSRKSRR